MSVSRHYRARHRLRRSRPIRSPSRNRPIDSPPDQLALHGGPSVLPAGPPPWPCADEDVRAALESVYADGDWGRYHGRRCGQLIEKLSAYHAVHHVMLCSSGTIAVEIALRGLGVGPGDEVILAGYDFSGNFRCIEAIGARPVLVDVDPKSWSLDPQRVTTALSDSTRAIIASHLHGGVVPMRQLMEIAAERNVAVVEDACQSPGAKVQGRVAGAWGDVGVLSFGGSKLLTAGRGGAILTSREEVHQRAKVFCERGNQAFPMSELQAAVLLPQLDKLDARNKARWESVRRLLDQLVGEKGDRHILCEAPSGPLPQNVPVPFFSIDNEPAFYKVPWLYDVVKDADAGGM
ncbi:MAG: aminotransferase class V-fold PLP-dependent enzyme, partial [Planctomycetes bacterium]|nr:aminotransferase class V-fold PLP-dependent enzyme [Planctomycetota bacterium]